MDARCWMNTGLSWQCQKTVKGQLFDIALVLDIPMCNGVPFVDDERYATNYCIIPSNCDKLAISNPSSPITLSILRHGCITFICFFSNIKRCSIKRWQSSSGMKRHTDSTRHRKHSHGVSNLALPCRAIRWKRPVAKSLGHYGTATTKMCQNVLRGSIQLQSLFPPL